MMSTNGYTLTVSLDATGALVDPDPITNLVVGAGGYLYVANADGTASSAGDRVVSRAFESGSRLRGFLKRLAPYAMQRKYAYRRYGIYFPELGAFWGALPFGLVCMLKRMDPDNGTNIGHAYARMDIRE